MKDVIGLINDTMDTDDLKELLKHRSVAAVPFGGRYRLIDFPLSNMVNSGIKNVGIFTNLKSRSLLDHLGSGKDWNLGTKKDGLFILPPAFEQGEIFEKFGEVDYFSKHRDYIELSDQKYVIVSNSNSIYNLNLNLVKKFYFDSYADIVLVYKKGNDFPINNQTVLEIESSSQRVIDIAVNPYKGGENIYCNILFMRKELFLGLIDYCVSRGFRDLMKDGIIPRLSTLRVMGYKYDGFYGEVNCPLSYYRLNKALLQKEVWKKLFMTGNSILTRVQNEPPARYVKGCSVYNSLIANGCIIEGKVINSILFRGVKVKKGSVVKDSIIMQKGIIGENSIIENSIVDKNVIIKGGTKIIAPINYPIIIERRTEV